MQNFPFYLLLTKPIKRKTICRIKERDRKRVIDMKTSTKRGESKMKKKLTTLLLMIVFTLGIFSVPAHAANDNVKVVLPAFKVTLNGTVIENETNQYPLIVYKDITYFPMTYYDCRFLGLESVWNSSNGLKIARTGVNWGYHKYQAAGKNNTAYKAQIAAFEINVNGKQIDNSKEEYPLLVFRNITYFPLTWRFAVDEFGWKYFYDENSGLVINSTASDLMASQVILPIVTLPDGEKGAFTMAGSYYYYQGEKGKIYQAPAANPSERREVYQLPEDTYFGAGYASASLQTDNGKAVLKFHTGGATMGSDHIIWLNEDGTTVDIDHGYSAIRVYDDYTVRVDHWAPPIADNLQIKKTGENEYTNVGDPECYFGRFFLSDGQGLSSQPSQDLYLIDEEIYVLGYYQNKKLPTTTGIYRVNINSGHTERVCEAEASGFKITDDMIYFTDRNQYLYRVSLSGGQAELLIDEAVSQYELLQGHLYYALAENGQLFALSNEESINPGGQLKKMEIQNGYLTAIFMKDSESSYKMMIIDKNGQILYKSMENIPLVTIENSKVILVKDN